MNQIIDEIKKKDNKDCKNKLHVEFNNKKVKIPYYGNLNISSQNSGFDRFKVFIKNRKYKLQFIFSFTIAIISLIFLFWKSFKDFEQEKLANKLLNNYQLTTLYSDNGKYEVSKTELDSTLPFVIGIIKIDKIDINYPILSKTNDDLLKISVCRFAGPNPNEIGNICIAGHNYIDNRFFSNLNDLEVGDLIEIYDIYGNKQNYYVFKKYEVEDNNLTCTNQDVGNNKIVTLLTCNNSNSKKRIIVQAK